MKDAGVGSTRERMPISGIPGKISMPVLSSPSHWILVRPYFLTPVAVATMAVVFFSWTQCRAENDAPAVIVRVQKPMVIDGDTRDWECIRAEQTVSGLRDDCATFKLACDESNFYALVTVVDDTPLKNSSSVIQELLKGGDALGFCFGKAGANESIQRILIARIQGKPAVVAMRPQWPIKKPYSFHTDAAGTVKMDFVAALDNVRTAFKATATGYVVEVAIPWSELKLRPDDELQIAFDLQVIFSDAAGSTNSDTRWWHSIGSGPLAIQDIATEARLYPEVWGSAKFFATDPGPQKTLRNHDEEEQVFNGPGAPIVFEMPHSAKASLIIRDNQGWIVRELLRARPFSKGQHTVYWNGRDRTGQPMPPGDYSYRLGIYDGIKTTFYGSVGNSGRPVFHTADGNGSIGGIHGGPTAIGAGIDGIYMLHSGEEGQKCLRKIDPVTGKAVWWASTGVFGSGFAVTESGGYAYMVYGPHESNTYLSRMKANSGEPVPIGGKPPIDLGKIRCEGIAVAAGKLYFSEPAKNRIGIVNLDTGNFEPDIAMPSPRGLVSVDEDYLLICSETRIVKMQVSTGRRSKLIENLVAPRAVAVSKDGQVFVTDLGTSQQIKCLSPQGKLLGTIGKAGGRGETAVPYDPLSFRDPTGIAVGPDGNIWVVENASPRRFAKISPDGRWLEDFYGPTGFITVGVDLDNFSNIYYQATQYGPEYVKARVNYSAYAKNPGDPVGAWKVEALLNMTQNGIDRTAVPDLMSNTATASYGKALIFLGANGKRYFWKPAKDNFALWREENGRWISASALVKIKSGNGEKVVLWSDSNGDGLVQPGEVTDKTSPIGEFTWIDRDLTLHGMYGSWKPVKIEERGVPNYVGGAVTSVFSAGSTALSYYLDQENYGYSASPPAAGARYYCSNVGAEQGHGFWDRAAETRLLRVKDGRVQWMIGHHDARMRFDGDNQMLMNLAGELDGVVIAAEVSGCFTAYTDDGLTLGWIAADNQGRMAEYGPAAW